MRAGADAEELRQRADEILSRSEFVEEQPTFVERAFDWVFEQLGEVLGTVFGQGGGYYFGYAVLVLAVGAAAYLLWRYFPRRSLTRTSGAPPVAVETTVRRSRAEWLAQAEAAEAAGRWSDAVHARYHALTTGLADADRLPSSPSTTSGEHRRAFAAGEEPGAAAFNRASDRFEEVWFGGHDADRADTDTLAATDSRLLDGSP